MAARVYKISFPDTDKCYIGSTRLSLRDRYYNHVSDNNPVTKHNTTSLFPLFAEFGSKNGKIELIEELENPTKQELLDRERHYILNTVGVVNKNIPQPKETNQITPEGKKAYHAKYYQENKANWPEYDADARKEYNQRTYVKEKAAIRSAEYRRKFPDKVSESRHVRIDCEKCGSNFLMCSKARHDKVCKNK